VKRSSALALFGLVGLLLAARPASAGGGSFTFGQASYEPGDRAYAWGDLYDAQQVREDGPFGAWIVPESDARTFGDVPPGAVYVGDLTLHEGDHPSALRTAAWVEVTFTVPDLAPGEYTIVECNRPCTTGIEDITGRHPFTLVAPAAPTTTAPPPTAPAPTTTTAAPATTTTEPVEPLVADSDAGGSGWGPLGLGVGGGLVLAAVVWLGWGRRQPTTNPA